MSTNAKSFTYHYIAIPPCNQIGMHSQPNWELSLVVKGCGQRTVGDTTQPFADGDLVLIPPETKHCWYFDNDHTDSHGNIINVTVTFSSELLMDIAQVLPETALKLQAIMKEDHALFFDKAPCETVAETLCNVRELPAPLRTVHLLEVLVRLSDKVGDASFAGNLNLRNSAATKRMQIDTFIACNYNRNIDLDDMAKQTGMNKSSFCAFFHRHYGETFIHHLNNYRLDKARLIISKTGTSISEACYQSGFQSVSHFNHLYKARFGTSPSKDKRLQGGANENH